MFNFETMKAYLLKNSLHLYTSIEIIEGQISNCQQV